MAACIVLSLFIGWTPALSSRPEQTNPMEDRYSAENVANGGVHPALAFNTLPTSHNVAYAGGTMDETDDAPLNCQDPKKANSPCVEYDPLLEWEYVEEAHKYFDGLDSELSKSASSHGMMYTTDAIRWEWPPWLLLTGYTGISMSIQDPLLHVGGAALEMYVQGVPRSSRECRLFKINPFVRCLVFMDMHGSQANVDEDEKMHCDIYEEFTYVSSGKISFVEAWANDVRVKSNGLQKRLSTRVPGLGSHDGQHTLNGWAETEDEVLNYLAWAVEESWPDISWPGTMVSKLLAQLPKGIRTEYQTCSLQDKGVELPRSLKADSFCYNDIMCAEGLHCNERLERCISSDTVIAGQEERQKKWWHWW